MQLRAANGAVRCGSCLDIFNAPEHFLKEGNAEKETPTAQPQNNTKKKKTLSPSKKEMIRKSPSEKAKELKGKQKQQKQQNTRPAPNPDVSSNQTDLHNLFSSIDKEHVEVEAHNEKLNLKVAGWVAIIILGLSGLVGQYAWFNKDNLAITPRLRPVYLWVCEKINCELPSLIDIQAVKSVRLVVRTHPEQEEGLIIDSVIINEADFSQPWPMIEFNFTDINGQPVANRIFRPNEYLGGVLAGTKEIPSKQPVRLSIEIVDPGKEAVNYQLKFHST